MPPSCAVIIVTYNSERDIHHAMDCLQNQSVPASQVIIVDSGSAQLEYLTRYRSRPNTVVLLANRNVGFCKGNNLGVELIHEPCDYVLFLNPDAFLTPRFLEEALAFMEQSTQKNCGAMTGILLGYDREANAPNGKYDSTGVFPTWYGKWYDRDQRQPYNPNNPKNYKQPEQLPAICGALMLCRKTALDQVLINGVNGKEVFDSSFFMYKEDIDLSCRLRQAGWTLMLYPSLLAYHCRGWSQRRAAPRALRLQAALNELRLHWRHRQPIKICYSLAKYLSVYILNL